MEKKEQPTHSLQIYKYCLQTLYICPMSKSLLFIPDISGFTNFVQTTEVEHSQHVIAELLEVLISANTQDLKLAEVEGDALFFYKENAVPSKEKLLAQIETMYTAFYSHLKMMETNRICPCNACASAPKLQLKIILHTGELQFLTVQGNRKPFGEPVIQAHRLLKNKVESENYALISSELAEEIGLTIDYDSQLYHFREGLDTYDGVEVSYLYSEISSSSLKLNNFAMPLVVNPTMPPDFTKTFHFKVSAYEVYEIITNYRHRHKWVKGVDEFIFNENEVSRVGTEHVCIINGKHFNFTTVIKEVPVHQLIYGELTFSPPPLEKMYQFFVLAPIRENECLLTVELFWETKTVWQKFLMLIGGKKQLTTAFSESIDNLHKLMHQNTPEPVL